MAVNSHLSFDSLINISWWIIHHDMQITWSTNRAKAFYFRTSSGHEVNIILEARGKIVGIECKASSSVGAHDFEGSV